jgi:hypothetical protein
MSRDDQRECGQPISSGAAAARREDAQERQDQGVSGVDIRCERYDSNDKNLQESIHFPRSPISAKLRIDTIQRKIFKYKILRI